MYIVPCMRNLKNEQMNDYNKIETDIENKELVTSGERVGRSKIGEWY